MCFSIGVADKRTFCLWISSNLFGRKHQSLNPMQELWSSKSWASFQSDVEDCCMIIVTNTVRSVKWKIFRGKKCTRWWGLFGLLPASTVWKCFYKSMPEYSTRWNNLAPWWTIEKWILHLFCRRHFQVFLYSLVNSIASSFFGRKGWDNDFWLVQPFQPESICFYSSFGTIS